MPPTVLIEALQDVRKKVKALSVAFGVGVVIACAIGVVVLVAFLDWCFDLPTAPRLIFVLASLGGIGWAVHRWVVKPAMARLSLGDVAGRLENAFPEFSDRLRSTVHFVNAPDSPGSDAMKDRVVTEATQLAQRLDLRSALVLRPVVYSSAGATAAVVLVLLLGVLVGREYFVPALARLINPFSDRPWPKRVQIDAATLPARVPLGAKLAVSMKLAKGDKASAKAIVYYQYDDGPVQMLNMSREAAAGAFTASLDARGNALKVWMESGDDKTKAATVAVVPRLAITGVTAVVAPPKYANLEPINVDLGNRPALVVFGSDVQLKVAFNKPLDAGKALTLEPVSKETAAPELKWDRGDARTPAAAWNARQSLRFRIHATDTDGFTNTALEEYEVLVQPDQLPRVVIEKPTDRLSMAPEATVRLQVRAEDDFDIKAMSLVVDRVKRADKSTTQPAGDHWEVPLSNWERLDRTGELQPFRLNYAWELPALAKANLQPGDTLEYYVQVLDNFELDGATHPPVASRKLELLVISQKDVANNAINTLRQVGEEVQQVQTAQRNAKEATRQLQEDTKNKPALDKADKDAADRRAGDQSTLASQTRSAAQRAEAVRQNLEDNKSPSQEMKDLARDVKDNLDRAADGSMKKATEQIAQAARQNADPKAPKAEQQKAQDDRNESLAGAQAEQQKANEQLQQAMDRMKNIGTLSKAIESVRKLLDQQQKVSADTVKVGRDNLGKKPEEMSKDAKDQLAKNAKEQSELAKETQKAAEDLKKTAEQMSKSDQSASDAMKQAAKTAQDQNVAQKQQQAAEQAEQNQQSQAQNNQKQAELGLQMMLDTLREAEKHKLEKLAKQLDSAMDAVKNLIRQQAGHNVDNLLAQGGDKAKLVTDELLAKARRTRDHLPPLPGVPQLVGLQEQTERNTSDVLKQLGEVQGAAEAGANLNRASTKMGYAIVNLRDRKLPEAFDPHQSEALSALEAALTKLDDQKQQAQAKMDQQRKEKVRDAYVKVRDEQVKLNDRTAKIDKGKTPEGAIKHADRIDLGKLPGEQGTLADKIKSIGDDLADISIVYRWANTDIGRSMNEVKDDLAKPETGPTTQAEQVRVVDQLTAMIDNLAIKPPEPKKFADKNGGGGQGKPKPGAQKKKQLPGEIELKLLKDLQVAINKSTVKEDAEKDKQNPAAKQKLASLGGRQGEMRDLLDQMLKKGGGEGLPAKPDKADALPEEAGKEQIEDDELQKNLLEDKPAEDKAEKDIGLVGDRMARSQQRLAEKYDPGKTTQKIQERIVMNIDDLIQEARQQQQQQQQQQASAKPGDQPPKPGEGDEQAQNQGDKQQQQQQQPQPNQQPAKADTVAGANENDAQFRKDLKETADNWGQISPRLHDAVVEGANEKVPEKYRSLVQDYYRSLATKATEHK